jgi:hypothetical protein
MHTAPCIVGNSFGIGVPGFGISGSNGEIENNCNYRTEAQFLNAMLSLPHGPGRTAAIFHACSTDESLRATLVGLGHCNPVNTTETAVSPAQAVEYYRSCVLDDDGSLRVRPAEGVSANQAQEACLQAWRDGLID